MAKQGRGNRCPVCNELTEHWDRSQHSNIPTDVSVCSQCHVMIFGTPRDPLKEVKDAQTGKNKWVFEAKDGE